MNEDNKFWLIFFGMLFLVSWGIGVIATFHDVTISKMAMEKGYEQDKGNWVKHTLNDK